MVEVATEGNEPYQSEQDGETGNDFSVDESSLVVGWNILDRVEVLASQSGDYSCEGELGEDMSARLNWDGIRARLSFTSRVTHLTDAQQNAEDSISDGRHLFGDTEIAEFAGFTIAV